jgi:hypothetical protein
VDALFAEAPVGGMPPQAGYYGFSVEIAPSRQAPRAGTGPSLATLISAGIIGSNSAMGAGRNDVLRADGVTSLDAGNLAVEGGMPQNLDATAMATAHASPLRAPLQRCQLSGLPTSLESRGLGREAKAGRGVGRVAGTRFVYREEPEVV